MNVLERRGVVWTGHVLSRAGGIVPGAGVGAGGTPPQGQLACRGRGRPWGEVRGVCFTFPAKMMALGNRLLRRFCWVIIKLSSARSGAHQGQEPGLSGEWILQEGPAPHTRAGTATNPIPVLDHTVALFFSSFLEALNSSFHVAVQDIFSCWGLSAFPWQGDCVPR